MGAKPISDKGLVSQICQELLKLNNRVPEELWMEVQNIVQEVVIKTIPRKKKC